MNISYKNSKKFIPNPNLISDEEKKFVYESSLSLEKEVYKGYMISMPTSFHNKLCQFLKAYPSEGTKSSLIVRVISDYIDIKKSKL